jgi:hypothetical protein
MSCTFDLPKENCPLKNPNDWQIQDGAQTDQIRPVSDHTRGGNRQFVRFEILIYLFQ